MTDDELWFIAIKDCQQMLDDAEVAFIMAKRTKSRLHAALKTLREMQSSGAKWPRSESDRLAPPVSPTDKK